MGPDIVRWNSDLKRFKFVNGHMPKQKIITVNHLIKRYKKSTQNAVDDISFYVEKGAFFALLGPNGAGKTTTISILTTLLSKTSGKVQIAGFDVETQANHVRQQIGVIFQNPSLDKHLTAEENVRFHVNLYNLFPYRPFFKFMPQAYQQKVLKLAQVLGIEKEIFHPIKTFSGGMKRKLEIIRGLMHHPKVLFLDEPTTGLDPVSRASLWKYLQQVRQAVKVTFFLTTHYLAEAETADYICILNHGKIVSQGTPKEITESLVKEYLLINAKDQAKLKQELTKKNITHSPTPPFRIDLNGQSAQKVIQQIHTPLSLLKIHQPTLEQAYLEIISNDEQ